MQASEDREARCPGAPTCQSRSLKSAAGPDARHHGGPEQQSEAGSVTAATPEVRFKWSLPADLRISRSASFLPVKAKLATKLQLQAALQKAAQEDWDGTAGEVQSRQIQNCRKCIFRYKPTFVFSFFTIEFALKNVTYVVIPKNTKKWIRKHFFFLSFTSDSLC